MGAPDPTSLEDTLPTTNNISKTSRLWENQPNPSLIPILLPVLSNAVLRLKSLQPLIPFLPTGRLAHEVR
ncbi:hypothetical protein J7T55_008302 [Diaporthe amygdali]|uniref:uncharacterized protein n=1 Tax=Phomopsis amygdali TaxID=1214568 RepID=UPI0022FE6BD3|nr:uncharacterized protein J7T55_008302 [Diaporthe amygdali]KAJ0121140.1 hypothetical protein J7T55_008302 [Diaporthe amygdali]